MDIRMIALDLDGTLLNLRREVSDQNLRALEACAARGIRVVLASGRSFEAVRRLALRYRLKGPIISVNGARVDLSPEGPMLLEHTYPRELAVRVFDIMKQSGIYFTCYGRGTLYQNNLQAAFGRHRGANLDQALQMQAHRSELVVSDESRTVHEGLIEPYKFVAFTEDMEKLSRLRAALADSGLPLNVSSSWFDNIEVMVKGAGKDSAIRSLCALFGIRTEQVMAFGDNLNDVDMLNACGVPVAMENALDEVKRAARIIAPHHDQSGVAQVLFEYVLEGCSECTSC